jgi:hypothetical protein
VIRVYDHTGNVIETHEHTGDFKVHVHLPFELIGGLGLTNDRLQCRFGVSDKGPDTDSAAHDGLADSRSEHA